MRTISIHAPHRTLAPWLVWVCGTYAALAGALSFAGWALDVPRLTDWIQNGVSIQPNATVAVTCAGVALLARGWSPRLCAALAVVVCALGGVTLFEHASGVTLGVDALLVFDRAWGGRGTVAPGRMGVPGSVSWTLAGIGLILLSLGPRHAANVSRVGLTMIAIATLSLTGYLFGADPLFTLPRLTTIAMQTATFVLAVGVGLVASVPERDPMRTLEADTAAGLLARRTLPFVIFLPIGLGFLRLEGEQGGYYDTPMGVAILVLGLIVVLCAVVWQSVRAVGKREQALAAAREARSEADAAVRAREAMLSETQARLSAFLEQLPLGAGLVDREGRYLLLNRALRRFVGDRIPSRDPVQAVRWQAWDEAGAPIPPAEWPGARALRGEAVNPGMEFLFTAPGAPPIWTRVTSTPFRDEKGAITGAALMIEDIDARRRAEDALRDDDRKKNEFLAVLAHELRNPLAPIRTSLEVIRRTPDPALLEQARATAERQIMHLVRLVDDLLDISRITHDRLELRLERVDLRAVLRAAVETARPLIDAGGHTLHVPELPDPIPLQADPVRLAQVFSNLLTNAAKYTATPGRIDVFVAPEDDHVVVRVRDTGAGIPHHMLEKVFDPFVQSTHPGGMQRGLGIGLTIARRLVILHGGTLNAQSAGEGHGSVFIVRLPLPVNVSRDKMPAPPDETEAQSAPV